MTELDPRWEVRDEPARGPLSYAYVWKPASAWLKLMQRKRAPAQVVVAPAGATQMEKDYIRARNATTGAAKGCGREAMFLIGMFTLIIPLAVIAYLAVLAVLVVVGTLGSGVVAIATISNRRRDVASTAANPAERANK